MKKLGIIVQDLLTSQSNYFMIQTLNYLSVNNLVDCAIFYETAVKPILDPMCGLFHINKVYGFDGIVISTSLPCTLRLLNCPGPSKKYFYAWDLEWFRLVQFNYRQIDSAYLSDEVSLIARSNSHAKFLKDCWKNPDETFDNWNLETIKSICGVNA